MLVRLLLALAAIGRLQADAAATVVGFGSCHQQFKPTRIFHTIAQTNPDCFLFLGDNLYADYDDCAEFNRDQCVESPWMRLLPIWLRSVRSKLRELAWMIVPRWLGERPEVARLREGYDALGAKIKPVTTSVPVVLATWGACSAIACYE